MIHNGGCSKRSINESAHVRQVVGPANPVDAADNQYDAIGLLMSRCAVIVECLGVSLESQAHVEWGCSKGRDGSVDLRVRVGGRVM